MLGKAILTRILDVFKEKLTKHDEKITKIGAFWSRIDMIYAKEGIIVDERSKKILELVDKFAVLHTAPFMIEGLSKREFAVLKTIDDCTRTQGETSAAFAALNQCFKVSKSAVSQMLRVLSEKGLVERDFSESDRRIVRVALTPLGKEKLEKAYAYCKKLISDICDQMGEKDTEEFMRLLHKLYMIFESLN